MNRLQQLAGIVTENVQVKTQKASSIKEAIDTSSVGVPPGQNKQAADVKRLVRMMESNKSLMSALKAVNNGQEVNDFLIFVLENINPKVTGVQKQKIKDLIDTRFK